MDEIIQNRFLDQFFENAVALYPEAIAIEQDQTKYTYSEAEIIANRLAHFLISKGIAPE